MYYQLRNIWLLVFFLLLSIHTKASFIFLFISVVLFILYYIQKNRMTVTEQPVGRSNITKQPTEQPVGRSNIAKQPTEQPVGRSNITYTDDLDLVGRTWAHTKSSGAPVATACNIPFCNDNISLDDAGNNYMYQNQRLAGKPNPKTLIPPVITPPPMDLEHWRANNLINHSHINTGSQVDTYLSGYSISPELNECNKVYECNNLRSGEPGLRPTGGSPSETYPYNNINLYTQTIQPDVYTINEVIEPINANIGISYTPQFHPHQTFTNFSFDEKSSCNITEADVYDPRFSGYGSSYRSYIEPVTGQPRFYYDDVDSVRMPNYICRSNIDFAKYADNNDIRNVNDIRALAQDSFLRSSLQQRTELQERLMRKRNGEMWQLRKYPMRTF